MSAAELCSKWRTRAPSDQYLGIGTDLLQTASSILICQTTPRWRLRTPADQVETPGPRYRRVMAPGSHFRNVQPAYRARRVAELTVPRKIYWVKPGWSKLEVVESVGVDTVRRIARADWRPFGITPPAVMLNCSKRSV